MEASHDLYGEDNEEYVRTDTPSRVPPPYLSHELQAQLRAEDEEEKRYGSGGYGGSHTAAANDRKRSYQAFVAGDRSDDSPAPMNAPSAQPRNIGGIGARIMMKTMNWKEGEGLGREGQGTVDIIHTQEKNDTMGLGYTPDPHEQIFQRRTHSIDLDEYFPHKQDVTFFDSSPVQHYPPKVDFVAGMKLGKIGDPRDYDLFCEAELVQLLFDTKSQFDGMPTKNFLAARSCANPYETIGKSIFQNRAAVKMANLDHLFKLTSPVHGGKLFFADICAGPGGFTEYIMWRKQEAGAQGFGFTLKGDCDWQLRKFNPDSPWRTFRVCYGADGTGNIFSNENIKAFWKFICKFKEGGLDLVTADGGFSVAGEENLQEEKMRQLILCQILMMFNILAKGGDFMLKVFDLFTPFTVSLVYILYCHFEKVSIISPYTSRPANSERYIVCKNLWEHRPAVMDYLFAVNDRICNPKSPTEEIVTLVDFGADLPGKEQFMDYLRRSNIRHLVKQVDALKTIIKYIEDTSLLTVDQTDVEARCLREWGLPLTPKRGPHRDGSVGNPRSGAPPPYSPRAPPPQPMTRAAPPRSMSREQHEAALRNKHARTPYNSAWTPTKPREHAPQKAAALQDTNDLNSQYLRSKAGNSPAGSDYNTRKRKMEEPASDKHDDRTSASDGQSPQKRTMHARPPPSGEHHYQAAEQPATDPATKKRRTSAPPKREEEQFVLNANTLKALEQYRAKK